MLNFDWNKIFCLILIICPILLLSGLFVTKIDNSKQTDIMYVFVILFSLFTIGFVAYLHMLLLENNNWSNEYSLMWPLTIQIIPGITLSFGIDGISILFLWLTVIIFPLSMLVGLYFQPLEAKKFIIGMLITEISVMLCFLVTDLYLFYICFEGVLIPMIIILGLWGARSRKISANYSFFLYTIAGSFFLLFSILYVEFLTGTTDFVKIYSTEFSNSNQIILWFCFVIAFGVKVPLLPAHLWLPEAHVEAPTAASMILAAILLKLGIYGMLRTVLPICQTVLCQLEPIIHFVCIMGIIVASVNAIVQDDLKKVVAYSSIAHMSFCVIGLFSGNVIAVACAVTTAITHGFCSAGLFFCVGILYSKYHTKSIRQLGGLAQTMPWFNLAYFILILGNMAFPGTGGFVGELGILLGVGLDSISIILLAIFGVIMSGIYSFFVYNRTMLGTAKVGYFSDSTLSELAIAFSFSFILLLLGLYPDFVLQSILSSVNINE